MQKVTQFVGEESQPLLRLNGLSVCHDKIPLVAEFGDRIGNRVVQTAVEGAKFVDLKRRIALIREIGNGLTQVAVVVHDLVNRKSERHQFSSVLCSCPADFG